MVHRLKAYRLLLLTLLIFSLQRHLVANHSEEGNSSCQDINSD